LPNRKDRYEITGQRGEFRQSGVCSAQPNVSISVSRNGKPIVVDVVFGENCYLGPSLSSLEFVERGGALSALTLCVLGKSDAPPACKTLDAGGKDPDRFGPIDQSTVDGIARR
jgi:hypothetical protein